MRNHPLCSILIGALLSTAAAAGVAADRQARPNFLFILVDDLGWADLECYGSSLHRTPHLNRLAATGTRFTDAYAACPVCSPTRAAILTGKYPARVGITDWIPGDDPKNRPLIGPQDLHQLPLAEITLAEVLKEAGYATFFAGKWHLGGDGFFPEQQGFDINKGGHDRGSPPGGYYAPYNNPKLEDGPEGEYLPDRLTDETIRFIEQHPSEPFLAYLSFYTVHAPIQASRRHIEASRRRAEALPRVEQPPVIPEGEGWTRQRQDRPDYASMVEAMDENAGRLLDALNQEKLSDRTVILFTSDNGGLSTLRGKNAPTCNLPLRAGKGWCYEGGIRVPLIIRTPGLGEPGQTCSTPVISTDFLPTILELAGLSPRPARHVDGQSLVPLLRGEADPSRAAIFWHYPHYHGSAWKPGGALRAGDWKLIEFYEENRAELYHLATDVGERQDLAQTRPDKVRELRGLMQAWRQEVGAQMPTPNPNFGGNATRP